MRPRLSKRCWLILTLALAWVSVPVKVWAQAYGENRPINTTPANQGKLVFEEWVVVVLDGKQCGFGSNLTTRIDTPTGPQFQTVHVEEFVVKRLGISLKMVDSSKVVEDADGAVLSFEQSTSGVGSEITSKGYREGDELLVTGRGQAQHYHIPRLAALGPEKIRQMTYAVPLKAGQTFNFNTFATDYPQAVVVESGTIVGRETRNIRGVERSLWKLNSEASVMPGLISTTWVDDKGDDVEALTVVPGLGDLHEYVTDRAECMKQPEGAEIFAPSMLHPQRVLPSPADQAKAVYRLTSTDPGWNPSLWNEGEQRVLSTGPGTCEVEVTSRIVAPDDVTWTLPHADTPQLHPYLQSSSYLEVNTPEIQTLARNAVGKETNPVRAAHLIERFVRAYISKKDLNIGFASAQETARSREGDCTEHAVLCAALGRAVGLPTRCVLGFGYIPPGEDEPALANVAATDTGIFGFHMWAEAWVGPDLWVPMDAALNGFDVGHIAIAKSALEEINPLLDLNAPVLQMIEKLKIEIVETVPRNRPISDVPTPATETKPAVLLSTPASPAPTRQAPALPPVD